MCVLRVGVGVGVCGHVGDGYMYSTWKIAWCAACKFTNGGSRGPSGDASSELTMMTTLLASAAAAVIARCGGGGRGSAAPAAHRPHAPPERELPSSGSSSGLQLWALWRLGGQGGESDRGLAASLTSLWTLGWAGRPRCQHCPCARPWCSPGAGSCASAAASATASSRLGAHSSTTDSGGISSCSSGLLLATGSRSGDIFVLAAGSPELRKYTGTLQRNPRCSNVGSTKHHTLLHDSMICHFAMERYRTKRNNGYDVHCLNNSHLPPAARALNRGCIRRGLVGPQGIRVVIGPGCSASPV